MDDLFIHEIQEEVVVKTEPGDEHHFDENLPEKFLLDVPHTTEDLMAYLNNHTNTKDKTFIKKEPFGAEEDNANLFENENHFMDPDAMIAHYEEVVQDMNTPVVHSDDLLLAMKESPRKETKQKKSAKKKRNKNDLNPFMPKTKAAKNIIIKTEEPDEDPARNYSYECSLCLFTTVHESDLKTHMLDHIGGPDTDTFVEESHNGEVYSCLFCQFTCACVDTFKNHIKFSHSGSPARSTRKRARESRRATLPQPESDDYDDGDDTETHMASVPDFISSNDVFPCKLCSAITVSRDDLHKHMVQCHKQKLLECTQCDFFTVYKSTLKRHEIRHSQVKVYKCKFCNFSTYNNSTFESHELSHTELKPFPCDECTFRAKSKDSLRQHKKLHSGDMPFVCSYCPYKAGKKSRIIRHERIHTGERPYACPHCTFRCNQGSTLKIHIRRHTGEKPYECHMCSFRAVSKCSLNAHLKKHNSSKGGEYICRICEQIYNNKAALMKHEKSHEEEESMGGYMKPITNKKRKSDFLAESTIVSPVVPVSAKQASRKRQRTSSTSKRKSKKSDATDDEIGSSPIARLYRCTVCPFRCSKFAEFCDHISSHKGPGDDMSSPVIPKKYRCTPCNVSFSRKREMKNHMKQQHERKDKDVTIKIGDYVLSVSDD